MSHRRQSCHPIPSHSLSLLRDHVSPKAWLARPRVSQDGWLGRRELLWQGKRASAAALACGLCPSLHAWIRATAILAPNAHECQCRWQPWDLNRYATKPPPMGISMANLVGMKMPVPMQGSREAPTHLVLIACERSTKQWWSGIFAQHPTIGTPAHEWWLREVPVHRN